MIPVFLLFIMMCNAQNANCQPRNGGYYDTKVSCERTRASIRDLVTDSQCKRVWADPN